MTRQSFVQAVVFDMDGLMIDSEPLAYWAWEQVLARYGAGMDDTTFHEILGTRVIDCSRLLCQRFDLPLSPEEAMAEREVLFLEAVATRLEARPGLHALLDALDARGLPLAMATSGHLEYVNMVLGLLGLEERFRAIITGDGVLWGKPAGDIYLLAAERLGIPSICCLALEDAPLGLQAACAAGMTAVAVPNQWTADHRFPGAFRVLASLDEVREQLDDLLSDGGCDLETGNLEWYAAAGCVVARDERVLVLDRRSRGEVRLPKGHVEPGEPAQETALRETEEESGYGGLQVEADLGAQLVRFQRKKGGRVARMERYFLATPTDPGAQPGEGEAQFDPRWLTWDEAEAVLTFEAEREWVRRARTLALQKQEIEEVA